MKLTTEYVSGILYRFIPNTIPFNVFLIYFMLFVSAVSAAAVFLFTDRLAGNKWAATVASLFYITAFPYFGRTISGGFVEEDFALPFIFLGLYFFVKAMERGGKKLLYSALAGFLLLVPLTSWHLTQFFLLAFIAFVIYEFFLRFSERDEIIVPFLFSAGFFVLGGLIIPTLSAENFLFSYGMLAVYSLILTWGASKLAKNKWACLGIFAAILGVCAFSAMNWTSSHSAEYGHVYSLIKYKILYLGAKPNDPTGMPFEAKVFWQAGFLSPAVKTILMSFLPVLLAAGLGLFLTVKKFVKGFTLPHEDVLLFFTVAFIPIYLLFDRLSVFLIFFISPFVGLLLTADIAFLKKDAVKTVVWAALTVLFLSQCIIAVKHDIKQRDVDTHNEIAQWLKANTRESDSVLANFGVSALFFQYSERPVVLHPMFETKDIRDKTKEFYTSLFGTEEQFYDFCVKYNVNTFVYDWHYVLDKSVNSIRYQINATVINKDCAAILFNFYPEKLKNFNLLYQNTYYRVYHVVLPDELSGSNRPQKYLPFFNPALYVDPAGTAFNDARAFAVMTEVWDMPRKQSLAQKYLSERNYSEAEKLFISIVQTDPYFPEGRMSLADFYYRSGRLDDAIAQAKEGLKLNPGHEYLSKMLAAFEAERKRK